MNTNKVVLGIDPGTTQSAFVVVNIDDYRILDKGKVDNDKMLEIVKTGYYDFLVIEGMTSYNQPIGQETMDSIFMSGRFFQVAEDRASVIPRREVLQHFDCPGKCNKDSYVRVILIDRFAQFDKKTGRGTVKNQDWFYGVTADTWQAYGLCVCWIDRLKLKQSATSV